MDNLNTPIFHPHISPTDKKKKKKTKIRVKYIFDFWSLSLIFVFVVILSVFALRTNDYKSFCTSVILCEIDLNGYQNPNDASMMYYLSKFEHILDANLQPKIP